MQIEDGCILLDGVRIESGCSVYHTEFERVLWFDGVDDEYVQFRTVTGPFSMRLDVFEAAVADGTLHVEA